MRFTRSAVAFAAGLVAGCMASGPSSTAQSPAQQSHASATAMRAGTPLVIDRTDLRIGMTVQYDRLPTVSELADLRGLPGLAHVVIALDHWPEEFDALQGLTQLPEEADAIVVLEGYPPSRAAADAWNFLNQRLRLVVVVDGPPASQHVIDDLNTMRHLERVVAQVDTPSRMGFERLQRPLSFRRLVP